MNKSNGILLFNLFEGLIGVGYYNQIFSLELAIFMSNYFKRELHLIITKPLCSKGISDVDYGYIFDYILPVNHLCPFGIRILNKDINNKNNNIHIINCDNYISSCIYVDKQYRTDEYKEDILEFANGRQDISEQLDILFNSNIKYVKFSHSNASRFFYNFYTTSENYMLMNKIAIYLNKVNNNIQNVIDSIDLPDKFISIHFRFGDKYMGNAFLNKNNKNIIKNLLVWLKKNNGYNYPLLIMSDDNNHHVINILKNYYKVILTSDLCKNKSLNDIYKNNSIAIFLIEKKICEKSNIFIGTITSTVSVHIQYMNYINFKPYENYIFYDNDNFNSNTLNFVEYFPFKKWNWAKINYTKGNMISWQKFFSDNVNR